MAEDNSATAFPHLKRAGLLAEIDANFFAEGGLNSVGGGVDFVCGQCPLRTAEEE